MYRKRMLATALGLCTAAVALTLLVMMSVGAANAALIGGVGGFTVEASTVEAENVLIYPDSGPVTGSSVSDYPLLHLELDSATITDLRLTKRIDDPLGMGGEARLVVTQPAGNQVELGQTLLKTSSFNASGSTFRGLQIRETPTTDASRKLNVTAGNDASDLDNIDPATAQEVTITGPGPNEAGITITDANIRTHYLTTASLTLDGLIVGVEYYDSNGDPIATLQ
jgi:hypothetical protein